MMPCLDFLSKATVGDWRADNELYRFAVKSKEAKEIQRVSESFEHPVKCFMNIESIITGTMSRNKIHNWYGALCVGGIQISLSPS
jgi:pyruvate carboxylase